MLNDIKIGLDFHGVITKHPEYFSEFCRCALSRGYEIHIITGGPQKVVEEYLRKHQILYTVIFAILDFYDAKGDVDFLITANLRCLTSFGIRQKRNIA